MLFTVWDYNLHQAIEYERTGECNQCGECCKRLIYLTDIDSGNGNEHSGNSTTNGLGSWSEVETNNGHREFVQYRVTEDPCLDESGKCHMLTPRNTCSIHDLLKNRFCCNVFPTQPQDIETFPECSYKFEEISRTDFVTKE